MGHTEDDAEYRLAIENEATVDRLIEERTQARADLFRAQERVRELEDMLASWGELENSLAAIDLLPEVVEYLEHGGIVPTGMVKRGEAFVKRSAALRAVRSVAIEIATKRREGK